MRRRDRHIASTPKARRSQHRRRRVVVATGLLVLSWALTGLVIVGLGNASALTSWLIVAIAFVAYVWTARRGRCRGDG